MGRAGFTVSGYQIVGLNHMQRSQIDDIVDDELRRASEEADGAKAPQPLVDVARIRERLLAFGWVKDARVSRRLPDTLVVDIVERTPAALWQDSGRLALIDADGVVLDRVPIDKMPDGSPGYSLLVIHPINRDDLPFRALSGLVDCDRYHDAFVQFPARWVDPDFNGVLPKGTPVVQCLPVRREAWALQFETLSEAEKQRVYDTAGNVAGSTGVYRHDFRAPKR